MPLGGGATDRIGGWGGAAVPDDEATLEPEHLGPDPLAALARWAESAIAAGEAEPAAMALATVAEDGAPRVRMVLLKQIGPDGLVFFTNHGSDKGRQLAADPRCAIALSWPILHRQVRGEGVARRIARPETVAYFASRPHGARVSAAVSPQSRPISSRRWLEARSRAYAARHPDTVPLPRDWGGYRLRPDRLEFWQGRRDRLHDRLRFTRDADGGWRVERLAP